MAPRLSGQTSIFGVAFFVSKSLLGIERQKKLKKFTIFTRKRAMLEYWPIPPLLPDKVPACRGDGGWGQGGGSKWLVHKEDFQMSSKWKLDSRILNNALAVYCLLSQRTHIAQIAMHKMNTYAFMDQNLAVIVFLQILLWAFSKTPLKIYRERNSLPNSGCYKSKRYSMLIIFIRL